MQADKFQNKKKFIIKDAISFLTGDTEDIGKMKHKLIYISNKQILPKIQHKSEKDALGSTFSSFSTFMYSRGFNEYERSGKFHSR